MRYRSWISVVLVLVIIATVAGCAQPSTQSAPAAKAVKIGALFPFSGSLALLGNETFRE